MEVLSFKSVKLICLLSFLCMNFEGNTKWKRHTHSHTDAHTADSDVILTQLQTVHTERRIGKSFPSIFSLNGCCYQTPHMLLCLFFSD